MFPMVKHVAATAKKQILLIFSSWVGLSVKQIMTCFVWLNIDLFMGKSITTEFRQKAAFGAQNLR